MSKLLWFLNFDNSKKPDIDLTPELLNELSRFRFPFVIVQIFLIIGTNNSRKDNIIFQYDSL